jgi:hypothetical protein
MIWLAKDGGIMSDDELIRQLRAARVQIDAQREQDGLPAINHVQLLMHALRRPL